MSLLDPRFCVAAMLLAYATTGSATSYGVEHDCRPVGTGIHCFKPPPPTPQTKEEAAQAHERVLQKERSIGDLVAGGLDKSSCAAAVRRAKEIERFDLAQEIDARCSAQN